MVNEITFSDLVKNVGEEVDSLCRTKQLKEVLSHIESLLDELNGLWTGKQFKDFTTDELSRISGNLAIFRTSLSSHISKAIREIKVLESQIKVREASIRDILKGASTKKLTVSDLNKEAEKRLAPLTLKKGLIESFYEELKHKWFWIEDVLHSIKLRIQVLNSDKNYFLDKG